MRKYEALLLCGMIAMAVLVGCSGGGSGTSVPVTTAAPETTATVQTTAAKAETTGATLAAVESTFQEEPETEEKVYDETIAFTATTLYSETHAGLGVDYHENYVYQMVMDKFNIDMELWACASAEAKEKQRIWINGGTMPDLMRWSSFSLSEYLTYVDQGMLKALPDDWKTKWPHLAKDIKATGLEEAYTIDGKLYIIPDAVFANFVEVQGSLPQHISLYFRKDWAEEVGLSGLGEDGTMTMAELKEYLQKVKDSGLTQTPLVGTTDYLNDLFYRGTGVNSQIYVETEDGFIYEPAAEEYTQMISTMQEWFNEGLIDPDYFLQTDVNYSRQMFGSGMAAALTNGGSAANIDTIIDLLKESGYENPAGDGILGYVQIEKEKGERYTSATNNYWASYVFSPNVDDKTQERILDMMDWIGSEEGQISRLRGIRGVDWDYQPDGSVAQLDGQPLEGSKDGMNLFSSVSICGDDYQLSGYDDTKDPLAVQWAKDAYAIRYEGTVWPLSLNYQTFAGESKSNYSVPVTDKITEIVSGNLDVESAWSSFLDEYKGIWQPLLDDLNATYY